MSLGSLSLRAGHHAKVFAPFIPYLAEEVERQGGQFIARKVAAQVVFNGVRYRLVRPARAKTTLVARRFRTREKVASADVAELYERLRSVRTANEYAGVVISIRRFVRRMRRDSEQY